MDGVRFAEGKGGDPGVEFLAAHGDHLIGALHHAEGRVERAAGGIREGLAGSEDRLLADDPRAPDLFHVPRPVGDGPVPGNQLRGLGPLVRYRDRVEEEPLVLRRLRPLRGILGLDPNLDAPGDRL